MVTSSRFCAALIVAFLLTGHPASGQATDARYSSAITKSRAAVKLMLERAGVPGASVAVAVGEEVVWAEGFGLADVEREVPVTPQTRFPIGSVSKAFTTAAFARAAERGLVIWDAPVSRYLPDFPEGDKLTPQLVAGHLSGLDDTFNAAHRETLEQFSEAQMLQAVAKEPRRFAPGTDFSYVTGSYTVLAGILSRATQQPFRDWISTELFAPLRMNDALPNDMRAIVPGRAMLYERADGKLRPVYADNTYKLAGAGFVATASDLARFGSALLAGKVVNPSSRELLFSPVKTTTGKQPTTGSSRLLGMTDVGVGLGWTIAKDAQDRTVIHQPGGGPGISSWLVLYPRESLVIAIVSNLSSAPVGGQAFRTTAASFLDAIAAGPPLRGQVQVPPGDAADEWVTIEGAEKFPLKARYRRAAKTAPAVLLLHQCDRRGLRTGYESLAERLVQSGLHVLVPDSRGFGGSVNEEFRDWHTQMQLIEPKVMPDVEAFHRFLANRPEVDSSRIAVVGASCGARSAIRLAAPRPEIRALVFISGGFNPAGPLGEMLERIADRPVFSVVAEQDMPGVTNAMKTAFERSRNDFSRLHVYKGKLHGTPLLQSDRHLETAIADWLAARLR